MSTKPATPSPLSRPPVSRSPLSPSPVSRSPLSRKPTAWYTYTPLPVIPMSKLPLPAALSPRKLFVEKPNNQPPPPKTAPTTPTPHRSAIPPIAFTNIALENVQKLVGLSRRAPPASSPSTPMADEAKLEHRMAKIEARFTSDIEQQILMARDLEQSMDGARRSIDHQQTAINELRRLEKKMLRDIENLASDAKSKRAEVDRCATEVTRQFEHQEKMVSHQLNELERTIQRDIATMERELLDELAKAEDYRDDETLSEIALLREEATAAHEAVKTVQKRHQELQTERQEQLRLQLQAHEEELRRGLAEITEKLVHKGQECSRLRALVRALQEQSTSLKRDCDEDARTLATLGQTHLERENLIQAAQQELAQSQREATAAEAAEAALQPQVEQATKRHRAVTAKLDNELRLQRRMEHAIQALGGHLRSYVKLLGTNSDVFITNKDAGSTAATICGDRFVFDKVAEETSPLAFSLEYTCLIEDALAGTDVSVVYWGHPNEPQLLQTAMLNVDNLRKRAQRYASRGWSFTFAVKHAEHTQGWRDLSVVPSREVLFVEGEFKGCGTVELTPPPFFEGSSDTGRFGEGEVKDSKGTDLRVSVAVIRVHGVNGAKEISALVWLVNLGHLSLEIQTELLTHQLEHSPTTTSLETLLHHCFAQSKLLSVLTMSRAPPSEALRMARLAERIKQTPDATVPLQRG